MPQVLALVQSTLIWDIMFFLLHNECEQGPDWQSNKRPVQHCNFSPAKQQRACIRSVDATGSVHTPKFPP